MITNTPIVAQPPDKSTLTRTLLVCNYLSQLDLTPKQFMVTFMSNADPELVSRRRLMKVGLASQQTRSIVRNLGKLARSCESGEAHWEALILEEATVIVNAQAVARGQFPSGAYVSSNRITPDYFSDSSEQLRETQVTSGMRFLHSLIRNKLAVSLGQTTEDDQDLHDDDDVADSISAPGDALIEPLTDRAALIGHVDEETVLSMENLVCIKASPKEQAALKLTKLPIMICSMIAVSCNRRANALPMANSLMTYAGGVSCRINEWLHFHGVTTSRQSTLSAMEHLRHLQQERMIELFKINSKLLPLLVYDNIDINLKIHNARVEASSRMFHGTWGFFIVVRACLQAKCTEEAVSLAAFLDAMKVADRKSVSMSTFCPTPEETDHWESVVKAQVAKALKEYSTYIPGAPDPARIPSLNTRPPSVDPIEMHQANIHFLQMMDAPDSSAAGVSRVLDAVIAQIGLEKIDYAERLLVAGGDVGSNQLLESLRVKRFPPIDYVEGMQWVLSIFGGAHTMWNFTKALLTHHWGKSDNGDDSGAWRSLFALGGEYKKAPAAQDFNTVMRSSRILHKGNLVHTISETLRANKELDLSKEVDCQRLIDMIWNNYFDADALETARQSEDPTRYNFMLRLRDFATVVEAHESTRAGNIGRLMLMWKKWAIMAQGIQGLSHYSRHIPRIVLLLEEDLPKPLAHAIKHCLLIPSNDRPDHWLPIDEFLEISIFYLKRVYNNTGHGTDIRRLTELLSNLIPMLRKLMQLFKIHSGHTLVFQPNNNSISGPSLLAFLAYAKEHLGEPRARRPSPAVTNIYKSGHRNMIKLIRADMSAGRSSRFRWGAADVLSSWDSQSGDFPGEE